MRVGDPPNKLGEEAVIGLWPGDILTSYGQPLLVVSMVSTGPRKEGDYFATNAIHLLVDEYEMGWSRCHDDVPEGIVGRIRT